MATMSFLSAREKIMYDCTHVCIVVNNYVDLKDVSGNGRELIKGTTVHRNTPTVTEKNHEHLTQDNLHAG
jgi:hypothetical protein